MSVKTQQNEIKIVVYEFLATKYPRGKKMDDVVFAADRIKGTKADMSMKEVINYACINYSPVSMSTMVIMWKIVGWRCQSGKARPRQKGVFDVDG